MTDPAGTYLLLLLLPDGLRELRRAAPCRPEEPATPSTRDPPDHGPRRRYYEYFPGGATEEMSSPGGTTTYGYDAMGDLTSESYTANGGLHDPPNVAYTYLRGRVPRDHDRRHGHDDLQLRRHGRRHLPGPQRRERAHLEHGRAHATSLPVIWPRRFIPTMAATGCRLSTTPTTPSATWPPRRTGSATRSPSVTTATAT